MQPLRIGLIGAGPWATATHAPGISSHPGTVLAGVWARRADAAEQVVADYGGQVFGRVDELIEAVDAVAMAVPPAVQVEYGVTAALAGRHLILEKPLAADTAGAQRLVDAVARGNVASIMMLILRFDPVVRGWLGGLGGADARAAGSVGLARWLSGALLAGRYSNSPWRHERGALLDVGPHVIDLMDAALGPVSEVLWADRADPDLWRFGLGHAGGATSGTTISLAVPLDPSEIEFAVFGPTGRHVLTQRPADQLACYRVLLDEFTAMVADGETAHPCDARRGLALQRVIDQVLHTTRSGDELS